MKLEIGPGFASIHKFPFYGFNPKIKGEDVVYFDLKPPCSIHYKPSLGWVVGDAHKLPFKPRTFKEVYASHLIEHLAKPLSFLKEAYRVLNATGRLYIWTPNFLGASSTADQGHVQVYNIFRLMKQLKQAGFKVAFQMNIGTKLPRFLRLMLSAIFLLISDELFMIGLC